MFQPVQEHLLMSVVLPCWQCWCVPNYSLINPLSPQDHDFFQHVEMHLRSEHPPLCGRDHLSFRSYYFPVKVSPEHVVSPRHGVQRAALGHRPALRLAETRQGYCLEPRRGYCSVEKTEALSVMACVVPVAAGS